MTVSPPDPDATLSGVSQQMFVTRHADHDTAVDGGVLRRDGEADMQTSCSNRQSSVPVESHTQPWRVGDLWADTVGSQSRAHDGVRFDEYRTQSLVVLFRDSILNGLECIFD